MEQRIKFSKSHQKMFLNKIKNKSDLSWKQIANIFGLSDRTIRDWLREKYNMSYNVALELSKKFFVPLPKNHTVLEPLWHISAAASMGGLKRQKLYGLLGNLETRRTGGLMSQNKRRENPELYKVLGCNVRKEFEIPPYSIELAELIGIILGDGGITKDQLKISLSAKVDREYAHYVKELLFKLFKEYPYWMELHGSVIHLVMSGRNLVEILNELGLFVGNKVKNQVSIPRWVLNNIEYRTACIRGLFDTDGGLYFHHHLKSLDKRPYLGWSFTNFSLPILKGFEDTLNMCGLNPANIDNKKLYMYSIENINKYMSIVGTHNMKNINKIKYYERIRPSVWVK